MAAHIATTLALVIALRKGNQHAYDMLTTTQSFWFSMHAPNSHNKNHHSMWLF